MDRALYISMTGAKHNMLEQAARSHNLANVSTVGFKSDFVNALSQPVSGRSGYASRVYAVAQTPSADLSAAPLMETGRALDVAVDGEGWLAVQTADGREAYSRSGNLSVDSLGVLRDARGRSVLGNDGPIALPEAEKVEIGSDGTISIRALGQGPETLAVIDRIRLVNPQPGGLKKQQDGLLYSIDGVEPVASEVQLRTGFLEGSNVNAVAELTSIISLARQFEMQIKMMQSVSENAESSTSVLRVQL